MASPYWLAALAFLLAVPFASGQDAAPSVAVLIHHPHPDDADPFGFANPAGGSVGYFQQRYGALAGGRFDFPFFVADGVVPVAGIVNGSAPFAATLGAYERAFNQRAALASPIVLEVDSRARESLVQVQVVATATAEWASDSDLVAHVALAEDNVFFSPPPKLSNGVVNHRFTVRDLAVLGSMTDGDHNWTHAFSVAEEWDQDQLVVVAWVQQVARDGSQFGANEVVQATSHVVGAGPTRQEDRGVLLEMLSATWCDPCLYGDAAIEELAQRHGLAEAPEPTTESYYRPPGNWLAAIAMVAAAASIAGARLGGQR